MPILTFRGFPHAWLAALALTALTLPAAVGSEQYVVVVLDDSGSMAKPMRRHRGTVKMDAAIDALLQVLSELPAEAEVGVVLLNGKIQGSPWVVPLGPIDEQRTRAAMQQVRAAGGTPLGRFMKVGTDELLKQRREKHYGFYRLLVVTDGEATDGDLVERYLPDILSRGITVDVIGVDMAADHSLATKVHTYRGADDPAALQQAVREVFAETSADAGDAATADFELLAAIPDEVAAAALAALGQSGDHPIGTDPTRTAGEFSPAPPPRDSGSSPSSSSSSSSRRTAFTIVLVIAILVVVGFVSMLRAAIRTRPR